MGAQLLFFFVGQERSKFQDQGLWDDPVAHKEQIRKIAEQVSFVFLITYETLISAPLVRTTYLTRAHHYRIIQARADQPACQADDQY